MPLNTAHFHRYIVQPSLQAIGVDSPSFAQLITATALTESNLQHLTQLPTGPAKGLFQMEEFTHNDIWQNFLKYRKTFAEKIAALLIPNMPLQTQLYGNHYYATAICAAHYLRYIKDFPEVNNLPQMAKLWKTYYNTKAGKGREEDFILKAKPILDIK